MDKDNNKQLSDLNKVLEISRAMVATEDLDTLLELIIEHSLELLEVERATLFLYDKPAGELVARIATGVQELRVPADKGICGQSVQTGQTIVVPDAYADDRFNPQVDRDTGFRTRNIMSVPLRDYAGGLVGVLQVLNKQDGGFADYDVTLAETLGAQAGVAIQRARLIDHYIQKQEMERAMEIARDIQAGLLPEKSPQIEGYDVAGLSIPADETGGDIFDYIPLADGHWAFSVADATGHGIGPALVIAETRAMLRTSAQQSQEQVASLSHMLETTNRLLEQDLAGTFVTCFLGILDAQANRLNYASAGHGPMIFYTRQADNFDEVPATGLPLAIMDDTTYEDVERFDFQPGDFAVITTDGVFEAADHDGEMFGTERMKELLRENRDKSAGEMIAALKQAVDKFTEGLPQADDITAIIIKRS